jgi:maleylpyruvate isomerase
MSEVNLSPLPILGEGAHSHILGPLMIKLYDYFRSTASYRIRIALHVKNLDHTKFNINLIKEGGEQHQADYKTLNPQGLVPTLVDTQNNIQISQSIAILEYLEEAYPEPAILPEALQQRAQARQISQIIACEIHPLNNLRVLQYLVKTLGSSEDAKMAWYHHWLKSGFDAIEAILHKQGSKNYCVSNSITMADICLIPQLYNANRFKFDLSSYTHINQVAEYCHSLPEFKAATPIAPAEI